MSSKRYTPEFKDEAVHKFDQSRSYRYPDERLSRGHDHIHQASQDRIALLATPTAYQRRARLSRCGYFYLSHRSRGHDLVIDGGIEAMVNDQGALQ